MLPLKSVSYGVGAGCLLPLKSVLFALRSGGSRDGDEMWGTDRQTDRQTDRD